MSTKNRINTRILFYEILVSLFIWILKNEKIKDNRKSTQNIPLGAHALLCIFILCLSNQSMSHNLISNVRQQSFQRLNINTIMNPSLKSIKRNTLPKSTTSKNYEKTWITLKQNSAEITRQFISSYCLSFAKQSYLLFLLYYLSNSLSAIEYLYLFKLLLVKA